MQASATPGQVAWLCSELRLLFVYGKWRGGPGLQGVGSVPLPEAPGWTDGQGFGKHIYSLVIDLTGLWCVFFTALPQP